MSHIRSIVIIAPYFYPRIGGVENYAYNLARRLHESGDYSVNIVTSTAIGNKYISETLDGMTVYKLPVWFTLSNTPVNPMWFFWFRKFFARVHPDIVNIHTPVPFMGDVASLALGNSGKTVVTYHSGSMVKKQFLVDIVIGLYEKLILPILLYKASAIIAVSEYFLAGFGSRWGKKTVLIRPGVDTSIYTPTPLVAGQCTVTYVGRVEHSSAWKGIKELLQAMVLVLKERTDAVLEIVGSGDAVEHFRSQAVDLGIADAVRFLGPKRGRELVEVYSRSNVVVLPSTSAAEQSSVVLIEAMASGRPVVGTRIGGTPKIIQEEENGLLVEPKDPHALASAILRVLNDKDLALRLAHGGVRSSKQVDWSQQAEKHRRLFDSILL